jgi:hypothetical protein
MASTTTTTTTTTGSSSINSSKKSIFLQQLLEFIEISVFVYLHNRKVYAENTFDKRKVFDTIIHYTRDPELLSYVIDSLKDVKHFLERGELKQICAVLLDQKGEVTERLDFQFVGDWEMRADKLDLTREEVRAGLVRLSRLALPEFPISNFSLAFEIGKGDQQQQATFMPSDKDSLILKNPPNLKDNETRHSTVPIVTLSDATSICRLVVKLETTLMS